MHRGRTREHGNMHMDVSLSSVLFLFFQSVEEEKVSTGYRCVFTTSLTLLISPLSGQSRSQTGSVPGNRIALGFRLHCVAVLTLQLSSVRIK